MTPEPTAPVLEIRPKAVPGRTPRGLWGRAFRPFFLCLAVYAALAVPFWAAAWQGVFGIPVWLQPTGWHGHEMVFGFVAAAIAGFLLTASPVWTGGPALTGRWLAALVSLWVAGRVAFACVGILPSWLVAVVDLAFLPAVALAVLRTLWGSGQIRNYAVLGIVIVLAAANAGMHAEALGITTATAPPALRLAVDAIVVLILVIGGRITPAFTENAFRRDGLPWKVRSWVAVDVGVISLAAALVLADLFAPRTPWTGVLAAGAGLAGVVRLAGWRTIHTGKDPLLWSLHAGSGWIVVGLLLTGFGDLGAPIPASAGLHALTAGGMGATILAVITRVGLGHTGRPLVLPTAVVWCFALVHGGALLRVVSPFLSFPVQPVALMLGAGLWAAGFALFAARYWRILSEPRPDGLPG